MDKSTILVQFQERSWLLVPRWLGECVALHKPAEEQQDLSFGESFPEAHPSAYGERQIAVGMLAHFSGLIQKMLCGKTKWIITDYFHGFLPESLYSYNAHWSTTITYGIIEGHTLRPMEKGK